MGRLRPPPLGDLRLRELAKRRLQERRRGAQGLHRPPDTTSERHGMTTATPRATGNGPFPYLVLAGAALVLGSDGALYASSRVLGNHPTPGSPSALVRALQAGYRPTTPVAVLASACLLLLL